LTCLERAVRLDIYADQSEKDTGFERKAPFDEDRTLDRQSRGQYKSVTSLGYKIVLYGRFKPGVTE
jgi:hypothetical protein